MLDGASPEEHRRRYDALRQAAAARMGRPAAAPAAAEVPDDAVVLRDAVPAGWYRTLRLHPGQTLRVVNPSGRSAVSVLLWNALEMGERFNAADTLKLQWSARLGAGQVLLSDMGRVLASITADTSGRHDALTGGSTPASEAPGRNTRDNFRIAAAKLGLDRRDIPGCLTLFAGVRTDAEGRFVWAGPGTPGEFVDLRAEMPLLAVLSNCPHPLDPAPDWEGAIEAVVWTHPAPAADDPCRTSGEEAVRAFENTADWLRGAGVAA